MRICLIAPIPPFRGGIAKYCYSLAQELEMRHELLLLSYKRQYPAFLYGNKSQLDPDVESSTILKEFSNVTYDIDSVRLASWSETANSIAAFRPDRVLLPWWVAYWAPLYLYLIRSLKKKGIRVTIICINVYEHEDNFFKKFLTKSVLKRADSIIVHSEQEKTTALGINPRAVVSKHLLPLFEYDAPVTGRHGHTLQMLFFGFVRPYKGLDTLLKAIHILRDRDILLTIAGEFWHDKDAYLKLVDELGISEKVTIVDRYLSDHEMSLFFSRADLVVLPYKEAKTSGVIATAYGFRKPVLATDVGGFHEIIQDGYTGKIVPPDDPQSIADGIAWFSNNRQINFADNIAEFTAHNMSWSSLVDAIETLSDRTAL